MIIKKKSIVSRQGAPKDKTRFWGSTKSDKTRLVRRKIRYQRCPVPSISVKSSCLFLVSKWVQRFKGHQATTNLNASHRSDHNCITIKSLYTFYFVSRMPWYLMYVYHKRKVTALNTCELRTQNSVLQSVLGGSSEGVGPYLLHLLIPAAEQ